jgi:hypothetical protein
MTSSRRQYPSRLLGALLGSIVIAAALAVVAPNASAEAPAHPALTTQQWIATEVHALLAHNPGSRQISTDSIQAAGGVVITAIPNSASGRVSRWIRVPVLGFAVPR